jgi:hypothetical protein
MWDSMTFQQPKQDVPQALAMEQRQIGPRQRTPPQLRTHIMLSRTLLTIGEILASAAEMYKTSSSLMSRKRPSASRLNRKKIQGLERTISDLHSTSKHGPCPKSTRTSVISKKFPNYLSGGFICS